MASLAIASRPGGCVDPADMSTQDVTPVSGIFPVDDTLHQLEIGIQAFKLWPYHASPAALRFQCLKRPRLQWHAVVPFTFRIQVSHRTQEPPSESLPTELGIQRGASWRTGGGVG